MDCKEHIATTGLRTARSTCNWLHFKERACYAMTAIFDVFLEITIYYVKAFPVVN